MRGPHTIGRARRAELARHLATIGKVAPQAAPDSSGGTFRMNVKATTAGTNPSWVVFALRNPTSKPIERWLLAILGTWRDVNPALPPTKIRVLGPPPTSGRTGR